MKIFLLATVMFWIVFNSSSVVRATFAFRKGKPFLWWMMPTTIDYDYSNNDYYESYDEYYYVEEDTTTYHEVVEEEEISFDLFLSDRTDFDANLAAYKQRYPGNVIPYLRAIAEYKQKLQMLGYFPIVDESGKQVYVNSDDKSFDIEDEYDERAYELLNRPQKPVRYRNGYEPKSRRVESATPAKTTAPTFKWPWFFGKQTTTTTTTPKPTTRKPTTTTTVTYEPYHQRRTTEPPIRRTTPNHFPEYSSSGIVTEDRQHNPTKNVIEADPVAHKYFPEYKETEKMVEKPNFDEHRSEPYVETTTAHYHPPKVAETTKAATNNYFPEFPSGIVVVTKAATTTTTTEKYPSPTTEYIYLIDERGSNAVSDIPSAATANEEQTNEDETKPNYFPDISTVEKNADNENILSESKAAQKNFPEFKIETPEKRVKFTKVDDDSALSIPEERGAHDDILSVLPMPIVKSAIDYFPEFSLGAIETKRSDSILAQGKASLKFFPEFKYDNPSIGSSEKADSTIGRKLDEVRMNEEKVELEIPEQIVETTIVSQRKSALSFFPEFKDNPTIGLNKKTDSIVKGDILSQGKAAIHLFPEFKDDNRPISSNEKSDRTDSRQVDETVGENVSEEILSEGKNVIPELNDENPSISSNEKTDSIVHQVNDDDVFSHGKGAIKLIPEFKDDNRPFSASEKSDSTDSRQVDETVSENVSEEVLSDGKSATISDIPVFKDDNPSISSIEKSDSIVSQANEVANENVNNEVLISDGKEATINVDNRPSSSRDTIDSIVRQVNELISANVNGEVDRMDLGKRIEETKEAERSDTIPDTDTVEEVVSENVNDLEIDSNEVNGIIEKAESENKESIDEKATLQKDENNNEVNEIESNPIEGGKGRVDDDLRESNVENAIETAFSEEINTDEKPIPLQMDEPSATTHQPTELVEGKTLGLIVPLLNLYNNLPTKAPTNHSSATPPISIIAVGSVGGGGGVAPLGPPHLPAPIKPIKPPPHPHITLPTFKPPTKLPLFPGGKPPSGKPPLKPLFPLGLLANRSELIHHDEEAVSMEISSKANDDESVTTVRVEDTSEHASDDDEINIFNIDVKVNVNIATEIPIVNLTDSLPHKIEEPLMILNQIADSSVTTTELDHFDAATKGNDGKVAAEILTDENDVAISSEATTETFLDDFRSDPNNDDDDELQTTTGSVFTAKHIESTTMINGGDGTSTKQSGRGFAAPQIIVLPKPPRRSDIEIEDENDDVDYENYDGAAVATPSPDGMF